MEERLLRRQVEWMDLSDAQLLATRRALSLLRDGPAYAGVAEDVAAGCDGHLRASPLKRGRVLHAYWTLDEALCWTGQRRDWHF